jgi:hypothetical protein
MGEGAEREIYFEFTAIGNAVKVVAIDSLTGIEVSANGACQRLPGRPSAACRAEAEGPAPARRTGLKSTCCGCARRPSKPWRVLFDMLGQGLPGEPNGRA